MSAVPFKHEKNVKPTQSDTSSKIVKIFVGSKYTNTLSAVYGTHIQFDQNVDHSIEWEAVESSGQIKCGSQYYKQSNA